MTPLSRPLRRRFSGATALAAFLLATLGLAAWLGWQALDAATSHRRTAEAVLRDYAGISAAEFARVSRDDLDDVLDEIFSPVYRFVRRGTTPPPEVVGWDIRDAMRDQGCRCPSFRDPLVLFRIDPDGSVQLEPDTFPARVGAGLAREMTVERPGAGDASTGFAFADAGEVFDQPVAIGYLLADDAEGLPEPTFGFAVPVRAMEELFGEWYDDHRLLPEPIAGDQPNDSLLYVTVSEPGGLTMFTSRIAYPTDLSTSASIGPEYGGLEVTSSIRPDAASQLIIGGLPNSRLPLLVILLILALGIGVAAVIQLRREQVFQRLREDFVSGVSHELRTPLAQIRMFSELQESGKLQSEEDRKRAVSIVSREARRLSHLVENILQFSRLRHTPEQSLMRERVELSEALADGLDAVTPLIEDRGMRLDISTESGLNVLANREALTRIVVNLVDNAVKYGPQGQTVKVRVARSGDNARLTVSDEGPGVPESDRAKVWKAYRRLDRDVKARLPGTGIGLSVVAELTSAHDGRVRIEDAEGGGARFVVEFPLVHDLTGRVTHDAEGRRVEGTGHRTARGTEGTTVGPRPAAGAEAPVSSGTPAGSAAAE